MATRNSYSHAKADNQKKLKCKESDVRLKARAELTDAQQLKNLDAKFGKGKGAKRERVRLNARKGK